MIKLIITLPDGSLVPSLPSELLEHRITIGSGVQNTLVVPHESVAEAHVELILDDEGYLVADLVGGGATRINGHAIEPGVHYQLETGTTIQMGDVEAVYISTEGLAEDEADAQAVAVAVHSFEHDSEPEAEGGHEAYTATPAQAVAVLAAPVTVAGEFPPGGYPKPVHPPGVFVPRKPARSLWVMASVAVTFVAVAAAVAAGYLSTTAH